MGQSRSVNLQRISLTVINGKQLKICQDNSMQSPFLRALRFLPLSVDLNNKI